MHDVIIAGAGVAGGYLAGKLHGLDVLVLEKSEDVYLKDSGIVSSQFFKYIKGGNLVEHEVTEMEAISPSGASFRLQSKKPFAYLLDRSGLSRQLRKAASRHEVRHEMVRAVEWHGNRVVVKTNEGEHEARMVVGADGALSKVRESLGIRPPLLYAGLFVRTNTRFADGVRVFFNKYYSPDFFSWVIGQNNEYGLITGIRPSDYLAFFKKRLALPDGRLHSYLVPAGTTRSYGERALLVGESCGQVKPITGGGIVFSLMAAYHASRVIREAFEENRFDAAFLSRYEQRWRADVGWEIAVQLMVRKAYRWLTNGDVEDLFADFGPAIERVDDFDYDRLSGFLDALPKLQLAKHGIRHLPALIRQAY